MDSEHRLTRSLVAYILLESKKHPDMSEDQLQDVWLRCLEKLKTDSASDIEDNIQKIFDDIISEQDNQDIPIGLAYETPSDESVYSHVETEDLHEHLLSVLDTLTSREEEVLKLRFGIDIQPEHVALLGPPGLQKHTKENRSAYSLDKIGEWFGVSRERIRQVEAKALRKLRHPSRSKHLKSFLDSDRDRTMRKVTNIEPLSSIAAGYFYSKTPLYRDMQQKQQEEDEKARRRWYTEQIKTDARERMRQREEKREEAINNARLKALSEKYEKSLTILREMAGQKFAAPAKYTQGKMVCPDFEKYFTNMSGRKRVVHKDEWGSTVSYFVSPEKEGDKRLSEQEQKNLPKDGRRICHYLQRQFWMENASWPCVMSLARCCIGPEISPVIVRGILLDQVTFTKDSRGRDRLSITCINSLKRERFNQIVSYNNYEFPYDDFDAMYVYPNGVVRKIVTRPREQPTNPEYDDSGVIILHDKIYLTGTIPQKELSMEQKHIVNEFILYFGLNTELIK